MECAEEVHVGLLSSVKTTCLVYSSKGGFKYTQQLQDIDDHVTYLAKRFTIAFE